MIFFVIVERSKSRKRWKRGKESPLSIKSWRRRRRCCPLPAHLPLTPPAGEQRINVTSSCDIASHIPDVSIARSKPQSVRRSRNAEQAAYHLPRLNASSSVSPHLYTLSCSLQADKREIGLRCLERINLPPPYWQWISYNQQYRLRFLTSAFQNIVLLIQTLDRVPTWESSASSVSRYGASHQLRKRKQNSFERLISSFYLSSA